MEKCPFCSGDNLYEDGMMVGEEVTFFIVCRKCGAEGPWANSRARATVLWNARVNGIGHLGCGIEAAIAEIRSGYYRSVYIHGDWSDYSAFRVLRVVAGEFMELVLASVRLDLEGPNGIISEMRDVAVVSIKALMWFKNRI